jgi:hypothetical protein
VAWTPWRKIADEADWYVDHCLRIPVCFELALGSMLDRDEPVLHYVGAGKSEAEELEHLAEGDHPIRPQVVAELKEGRALYYRATGAPTLEKAQALRDEHLAGLDATPAWNLGS